jgi:hypothetical protein
MTARDSAPQPAPTCSVVSSREIVTAVPFVALCWMPVQGRRLLALLVAVLCIVARLAVEPASASSADEVKALAGPGVVCRTSADAEPEREGPQAPDGADDHGRTPGSFASVALLGPRGAARAVATAGERRGDPKASRGPPSLVMG